MSNEPFTVHSRRGNTTLQHADYAGTDREGESSLSNVHPHILGTAGGWHCCTMQGIYTPLIVPPLKQWKGGNTRRNTFGIGFPTQTFPELEPTSLDDTPDSWDSLLGDVECTELQEENEDEEDMELNSETALASFAEFLLDAQKAEHRLEQEAGRKRKRKGYTGHSRQTAQRRKQAEIKMREQGYSEIQSFFGSAGKAPKTASEPSSSKEIAEISSDSESESSTDTESVEIPIAPPSPDVETFMDPANLAHS
ncbi:hypothetical protein C8R44DRAFT_753759 [Mycena epipterygia]|nr:hypothetical protein C8R44DRAFT_753759 [Mycena epipterygia]